MLIVNIPFITYINFYYISMHYFDFTLLQGYKQLTDIC